MALSQFSAAMDTIADAVYLVDRTSIRRQAREVLLAQATWDIRTTTREAREHTYDAIIANGVDTQPAVGGGLLKQAMDLKLVAEGGETEVQSRLLQGLQRDEVQRFLFSKPLPVALVEARFLPLAA